jgi:ABC-2 type transport system ATP-binding protein
VALIEVENLAKTFRVAKRHEGRFGAIRGLIARDYRDVHAVDKVSFQLEAGEMVGYIGPNGAGKSTTIKMLTGILVPSSGRIEIAGRVPYQERVAHVRKIGVVFGQRSQLWWDLPTVESFELLRHIYKIPFERWRENLNTFSDILELGPFLDTPVRQLSLGQRMRADLAAALLHDPDILFLDEPTIGLDVVAKDRIRQFLQRINKERGTTVILTTHDLEDIERLCQRVVLIDHGTLIYDGALEELRSRFGRERTVVIDVDLGRNGNDLDWKPVGVTTVRHEGPRLWFSFDRQATTAAALISELAQHYQIRDLTVEEPQIETIVRHIYESGSVTV